MRKRANAPLRVLAALAVVLSCLALPLHSQSRPPSLSRDLIDFLSGQSEGSVRVIAVGNPNRARLAGRRVGARERRTLVQGVALEVSREQLRRLMDEGDVQHLSLDLPVVTTMEVTNPSIGADQVWAGWGGAVLGLGSYRGVTGQGVGVAVVDSGIAARHSAVSRQIVASVDLASTATGTDDEFGHGTHVAGIIAGQASTATEGTGVAPGARLINVRVLGPNGAGYTSDVIAGIDWVIANRERYNIRVLNLSLGHPVMEPSATDPLCQAVARAFSAGIVVVASAGNGGRTSDGRMVLGGISSPGNSPFAITVGALSTKGTTTRGDDTVASYSSRGPTKFEFAVKPDVTAPGTRIVAPEALNSWISSNYPQFHTSGFGNNSYMSLSGTSMAAAVVSGGVALLLQANPGLTPAQVKLALQTTSTYMADAGLIGGGAGSINLRAARQVANDGLVGALVTRIGGQLVGSTGVTYWDAGTLIDRLYRSGPRVIGALLAPLVWLNPGLLEWGDLNLLGLQNPLGTTAPNYIVWGEVAGWTSSYYIVWGETIVTPQSDYIVWGEGGGDYIVWGESRMPEEP
jgi:serine protease AprX